MSTECGAESSEGGASSADVQKQLRDRAESIRREQTAKAVHKLEAEGTLSPAEREVVEQLGVRLTEALLARPEELLASRDPESARAIAALFELDGAGRVNGTTDP